MIDSIAANHTFDETREYLKNSASRRREKGCAQLTGTP